MPQARFAIGADEAVDFHLHTRASDGGWTPEQLVDYLAEQRFRVAAVCDHDTMRSVPAAMEHAVDRGILIVPGVEVTTWWDERQWHLLVYNVDPEASRGEGFGALLGKQQDDLAAAAERAVVLLEEHDYRLPSLAEVVAGRPLLPVHVLLTMIKDGHATNLANAHDLLKKLGEPMRVDVPLADTVALAHEAGGICVLAHPGRDDGAGILDAPRLDKMLDQISIDGLEGHYRSYTDDDVDRYRQMAYERGLLVSCGSDSHAPSFPVNPRPYRARWVMPFLNRLGIEIDAFDGEAWSRGAPDAAQLRQSV